MPPARSSITTLTYRDWNESVGRYCFSPKNAGKRVRLAVDPLVLQQAAAQGPRRHHFATPEAAAADFRTAVADNIHRSGWGLGPLVRGEPPNGLAKLALQVLAVFRISADDEGSGSYWAALREELGQEVDRRGVKPEDLDLGLHQRNWADLARWANDVNEGRLGRLPNPDPDAGGRRHVRLPLSHGLLRQEDIHGLHRFFNRINLAPGTDPDPEELLQHLRLYADDALVFRGAHARRVLQDERLPLAAEQIANAASQWDGRKVDLARTRGPKVRLWLSVRHAGETKVRGGLLQFDANGAGSEVAGVSLADVLSRGRARPLSSPIQYRPVSETLVVAARSLIDGRYVECRYIRPGDEFAIARPQNPNAARFEQAIRRVAAQSRVATAADGTDGLPAGWTVYCLRLREDVAEADIPAELAGRVRIGGVRLRVAGGLRVRGVWLTGAGPSITVRDGQADFVVVNGLEFPTVSGCLHPEHCPQLNAAGVHEVWPPGRYRDRVRFRVAEPVLARFPGTTVNAGWVRPESGDWPRRWDASADASSGSVRGPVIDGEWPPVRPAAEDLPAAQVAVQLAVALRHPSQSLRLTGATIAAAARHPNLLVRQLARAVRRHESARQE
jgi:hypothetical protein